MNTDPSVFTHRCERCLGPLTERRVSLFTDETICGDCHVRETAAMAELRLNGEPWGFAPKRHRRASAR
jgi:hypothetical protein